MSQILTLGRCNLTDPVWIVFWMYWEKWSWSKIGNTVLVWVHFVHSIRRLVWQCHERLSFDLKVLLEDIYRYVVCLLSIYHIWELVFIGDLFEPSVSAYNLNLVNACCRSLCLSCLMLFSNSCHVLSTLDVLFFICFVSQPARGGIT